MFKLILMGCGISLMTATCLEAAPVLTINQLFTPQSASSVSSLNYTFSGSTADSINDVNLCHATSSNCSSCSTAFLDIQGGSIPYSTSGTSYQMHPASLATYLQREGLTTSGTYYIGMYVRSSGLVCSGSSAYCSAYQDSAANPICMAATYDSVSGTVTALSQNDNGNVPLDTPSTQYAYVSSGNDSRIYQCSVASDGWLSSCASTVSISFPFGIAFATATNGTQHGYYARMGVGKGANICDFRTDNGDLSGCVSTPAIGAPSWSSPYMIAFATVNGAQYAYVTDGAYVYDCALNDNGTFMNSGCAVTPAAGAPAGPRYVAFTTLASGTQYAYVAGNNQIYRCSLNGNGTFTDSGCTSVHTFVSGAQGGLSIAKINGARYLYDAYSSNNMREIYRFAINSSDGSLSDPTTMGAPDGGWGSFLNMAFATVNGAQYAYIAQQNSGLVRCTVDAITGAFGSCAATPSSGAPGWAPTGIGFAYTAVNP